MTNKNSLTNLQCPMPQMDFDIITLGHGGGGLLTNRLLDKAIFELFDNPILRQRHDGAWLDVQGQIAFTTDSFVIHPIFFPGGNIGELAVNGTVNDIAMCGAIPKYISVALILEEGLTMEELWEVLVSIKMAAEKAGVAIVTGDTKVVERGKGDKIFINTTGIGEMHPKSVININAIKPGDKILVSGPIATHGMAIMCNREGIDFEHTLESDTQPLNHATLGLIENFGDKIKLLRDPTRGGLAATLNELARDRQLGIHIHQSALPIEEDVNDACEILGLDPLYVANEGVFTAFLDASIADEVVDSLRKLEETAKASIIGEVVDNHHGKAVIESGVGGKRVISMQVGEQLPRIC